MKISRIFYIALAVFLFQISSTLFADILVNMGDGWRYLDNGTDQGIDWRSDPFNDTGWLQGTAQLGYGDGDESTVVSYGAEYGNKYITTYFRHNFQIVDYTLYNSLTLKLIRDDGAVVYINGQEVHRSNMPDGSINYLTTATSALGSPAENEINSVTIPSSLLNDGDNLLAVEIHQAGGGSSDISFDLELIGNQGNGTINVIRGPYLQMGSHDSVVVRWRTDVLSDSQVLIGPDPLNLDQDFFDFTLTTEHEVAISGLNASKRYYYAIGSISDVLEGGDSSTFFETSPTPGSIAPVRIWIIGDSGTADTNAANVYSAYQDVTGTNYTNLWLMLGDNAYSNGTNSQYQSAVFNMYPGLLRQTPLWPTLGNHDGISADSSTESGPYYDIFTLPRKAEIGGVASNTEAYYSFDYANIHFVVLDSFGTDRSTTGDMLTWMETDLQSTLADWIIAFWHHPPYSKGSHNSDTETALIEMRENALPILEDYGVDLVLSGHSHSYERSKFIDSHYGLSSTYSDNAHAFDTGSGRTDDTGSYKKFVPGASHQGTVYAVAGTAGNISGGNLNHPAMYISLNELGSMILEVDDQILNARFINDNGTTKDYFTIDKNSVNEPSGKISGVVWNDNDQDGIREIEEQMLSGIRVELYNDTGSLINSQNTAGDGSYAFNILSAGSYRIRFVSGSYAISPQDQGSDDSVDSDPNTSNGETNIINLASDQKINNVDAGLHIPGGSAQIDKNNVNEPSGEVSGVVWNDNDQDGIREIGEQMFSGIRVELYNDTGSLINSQNTAGDGSYAFNTLSAGSYRIRFVSGTLAISPQKQGSDDSVDSDPNTSNGETNIINLASDQKINNVDAGLHIPGGSEQTVTFRNGEGGYSGAEDSYISSDKPNDNYGNASEVVAVKKGKNKESTKGKNSEDDDSEDDDSEDDDSEDDDSEDDDSEDDDSEDGKESKKDKNKESKKDKNKESTILFKWNVSQIPSDATITGAAITVSVFNKSNDVFNLFGLLLSWTEGDATWNNVLPLTNQDLQVGSFTPNANGDFVISLNTEGLLLVKSWVEDSTNNNGISIISSGTSNDIKIRSSEYSTVNQRPMLTVTYTTE